MVTELLAEAAEHPPEAAMLLLMVYVPGVLEVRSISPVFVLTNTNPGVDEKTPALEPPEKVGNGLAEP